MKRILILTILMQILVSGVVVSAQELKFRVSDFYQDQQDLSGQEENRDDGDGFLYAVIKVTSDNEDDDLNDFSFDFNFMKCSKEMRDGELWLFVQRNAKSVTIRRDGYTTLKYSLPNTIQAGKTYRMKLSMQQIIVHQRILQFMVNPANKNAIVKVKNEDSSEDYQLWGTVDAQGSIYRLLEIGEYLYEISADGHKTSVGKVTLSNGSGNYIENVSLTPIRSLEGSSNDIEKKSPTPGFGFLEISDDYGIAGAEVYINNRKVGTIPYKSGRMKCRNDYQLMISNGELYKTYYSTIEIHQGDTTTISPRLQSNFAEITIKVQDGAEIFIDGNSKGRSIWSGSLRAGIHNVECRLPNHASSQKQIVVKPNIPETYTLESPTIIEGSLYVKSNPIGAKIFLDDKDLGVVTPSKIDNIMIGSHKITVMLDDNTQENKYIIITKDEIATVDVKFSNVKDIVVPDSTDLTFYVDTVTFKMKLVEAGHFMMGSNYYSAEQPTHVVAISKDYYIGETEVTQALWKAVTGNSPTADGESWSSNYGLGDNYPAYNISYEDVQSFINKLNSMTGENFRMPTEAEWEFAACGGKYNNTYDNINANPFSGRKALDDMAWYKNNSGSKTHSVKTKAANELGIYDMSGNVWEWCNDWYGADYYSSFPLDNPSGPSTGDYRVVRGGSWGSVATNCRWAVRSRGKPSYRDNSLGIRLALSRVPSLKK